MHFKFSPTLVKPGTISASDLLYTKTSLVSGDSETRFGWISTMGESILLKMRHGALFPVCHSFQDNGMLQVGTAGGSEHTLHAGSL